MKGLRWHPDHTLLLAHGTRAWIRRPLDRRIAKAAMRLAGSLEIGDAAVPHRVRVDEPDEEAGLDISEHGMYGYPEQFIPAPELVGYSPSAGSATSQEVPTT